MCSICRRDTCYADPGYLRSTVIVLGDEVPKKSRYHEGSVAGIHACRPAVMFSSIQTAVVKCKDSGEEVALEKSSIDLYRRQSGSADANGSGTGTYEAAEHCSRGDSRNHVELRILVLVSRYFRSKHAHKPCELVWPPKD